MMVNTRTSVKEDELLWGELNTASDLTQFAELSKIVQLLRFSINSNLALQEQVQTNSDDISSMKNEMTELHSRVDELQQDRDRLDQYSRKDVAIITGLRMPANETQEQLYATVTGMFNKASSANLKNNDFVAIHRNSATYNGLRPPTITCKFLRFTDKDIIFRRENKLKLKNEGINIHHNMCRGLIAEQDKLTNHANVKFVIYQGYNRHFSVHLNNGKYVNKITSFKDFISKATK